MFVSDFCWDSTSKTRRINENIWFKWSNLCSLDGYLLKHLLGCIWQGLLENEYLGTSFAVGQVRTISGFQALQNVYNISPDSNSKWKNLLVLFLMAIGYRIFVFILLFFSVGRKISLRKCFKCNNRDTTDTSWWEGTLFSHLLCTIPFDRVLLVNS